MKKFIKNTFETPGQGLNRGRKFAVEISLERAYAENEETVGEITAREVYGEGKILSAEAAQVRFSLDAEGALRIHKPRDSWGRPMHPMHFMEMAMAGALPQPKAPVLDNEKTCAAALAASYGAIMAAETEIRTWAAETRQQRKEAKAKEELERKEANGKLAAEREAQQAKQDAEYAKRAERAELKLIDTLRKVLGSVSFETINGYLDNADPDALAGLLSKLKKLPKKTGKKVAEQG